MGVWRWVGVMARRLRFVGEVLGLLATAGLMSCAVVDQYSGRAVVYNVEAEHAQEQALLLNIVRAYLRRPMQFTTVSSITGSATATGGVSYATPVNVPFRPTTNGSSIAAFPPVPAWGFSSSLSGGPTFTIPVLDTQEFYQGLLTPLPPQIWDLYIQNTYPRDLLLNLIVEKIVIKRLQKGVCEPSNHELECELVLQNYVGEDAEIDLFQIFSDYLLALGMTTQSNSKPQPLLKPGAHVPAFNVNLNVRGISGSSAASPAPSSGAMGGSSSGGSGGATPATKSYSLCFAPPLKSDRACIVRSSLCGFKKGSADHEAIVADRRNRDCGNGLQAYSGYVAQQKNSEDEGDNDDSDQQHATQSATLVMSAQVVAAMQADLLEIEQRAGSNADLDRLRHNLSFFSRQPITIQIYPRSVESIIYYLGEVSRRGLDPDFHAERRTIYYTNPPRVERYPEAHCYRADRDAQPVEREGRRLCDPIFVLEAGAAPGPDSFLSTFYEGVVYSVPNSGTSSGPVLDIVKQALALESSAKSLPQSNVISVVGQ